MITPDEEIKKIAQGHIQYVQQITSLLLARFGERIPVNARQQYFIFMMNELTTQFMMLEKENGR